jgi:hypothetical protein
MKKCSKCKIEKPLSEFHKDKQKKDGFSPQCKNCRNKSSKSYKENNLLKVKEISNKSSKKYYEKNKEIIKKNSKEYYSNNLEYFQNHRDNNKTSILEYAKRYYNNNKEEHKKRTYSWRENNPQRWKEIDSNTQKNRRKLKPHLQKWVDLLKNTLNKFNTLKQDSTENLLGYSASELKSYLDKLGMDWGIHQIDHKIPITWFKPSTPPHIVNDLRNLQPLTEEENKKKSNKFCSPVEDSYIQDIKIHIKNKYQNKLCPK